MIVLRVVSLLGLAVWVGGLAAIGFIAAPAIFAAFGDADAGRAQAGEVFGAVFARFQQWAWIVGAVLIGVLITRALLGPRPKRLSWRVLAVAAMLAMSVATTTWVAPRIDQIRHEVTGAVSALPDADARKSEFGRLHALSSAMMLVTLAFGVGLIWMEAADGN